MDGPLLSLAAHQGPLGSSVVVESQRDEHAGAGIGAMLALLVGLVSFGAVWVATSRGMEYTQRDSPSYVSSAVELKTGNGYQTAYGDPGKDIDFSSTHSDVSDFPPGYPFALSLVMRGVDDPKNAPRLSAALITAAIALLFVFVAHQRGLSLPWSALVGVVAAALTLPYATAPLSEPLYGLGVAIALFLAGQSLRNGRLAPMVAAGVVAAGAVTVRTIGVALVGAVGLSVWLGGSRRSVKTGLSAGILLLGAIPFAAVATASTRVIEWHPPGLESLKIFVNAVVSWLVPPVGTPVVRVALAVLVIVSVVVLVWALRPHRDASTAVDRSWIWFVGGAGAVAHVGALLGTRALLDSQTEANARLLYPVAISLVVAGVELAADRVGQEPGRPTGAILRATAIFAAFALVAAVSGAFGDARAVLEGERGFASASFADSVAVERATDLFEVELFSNVPDGLWVVGVSGARPIPVAEDPLSLLPNPRLGEELDRLRDEVEERDAMVFYYRAHSRPYMVDEERLREIAPCVVADDGIAVLLGSIDNPACG